MCIVVALSKYFVLRNSIFNSRRFPEVSMSKLLSSGWLYYASGHGAVSGGPGPLSGSEHGKIWCRQETGVHQQEYCRRQEYSTGGRSTPAPAPVQEYSTGGRRQKYTSTSIADYLPTHTCNYAECKV